MKDRIFAWTAAAIFAAGCGGNVVVDKGGTSSNTIGGGGFGGSGGAGGFGGTGGTAPKICGGKQGFQCGPDEWCQWDPPGTCGGFDNTGICQPRPGGCPADCPGVCVCDGSFACNACEAHANGFDTAENVPGCGIVFDAGTVEEYAAYMLPTNAPRYVITKTEHSADRCLQIVVSGLGTGISDIDVTMGWGVESITISPKAADCAFGQWPAPPDAYKTDIAKGLIKQNDEMWPCMVDVDVAIAFPPGSPAWVPPQDFMQAFGLFIQGACVP